MLGDCQRLQLPGHRPRGPRRRRKEPGAKPSRGWKNNNILQCYFVEQRQLAFVVLVGIERTYLHPSLSCVLCMLWVTSLLRRCNFTDFKAKNLKEIQLLPPHAPLRNYTDLSPELPSQAPRFCKLITQAHTGWSGRPNSTCLPPLRLLKWIPS